MPKILMHMCIFMAVPAVMLISTPMSFFIHLSYAGEWVPMTAFAQSACWIDKHGRIPGLSMGIVTVSAKLAGIGLR